MPLAIPLIVLLALLVAMGMATVQRSVSGGFIAWAANALRRVPIFGGFSIDQIVKMDRYITHQLGRAANALTAQSVKWFEDLASYANVVGYWSLTWPIVIYHEVQKLLHHDIPSAVNARTKPLSRRIDQVETQAKATAGVAHSFPKVIRAHDHVKEITRIERVAMPHAGEWDWVHDHFKGLRRAVTLAVAGTIPLLHPGLLDLPIKWGQTVTGIRKRLRRLEGLLGVTGLAVAMAGVLGLGTNWRCLTRGNIGKTARALCGIPAHFLNDLLGLIADFLVLENVCVVLPWLEAGVADVAVPLVAVLTDVGAGLCHGSIGAAQPLQGPMPVVPPVTYGSASLAV